MSFRRVLIAVAVLLLGSATAVAVADTTSTGTVVACATATAPTHTVAVDGTNVSTVGGDTASQCATTTYTVPTVTDTVTVTNTTTTTSASGNVLFDGRAQRMTLLNNVTCGGGQQSPSVWTGLTFMNNDISLVADSRYGQDYKVAVPVGDHNPCNTSAPSYTGAGELTIRRPNELGKWDYFTLALKIPSFTDLSDLKGVWHFASLGYETIQGDQVALGMRNVNGSPYFDIEQNSGQLTKLPSGWYQGSTAYVDNFLPVTYGAWEEFVIGVKWATDNTGGVVIYARDPAQTSTWSQVFSRPNEPTYAYGTTTYKTCYADMSDCANVMDKLGLYYAMSNGVTPTETVYESGLTRSTDLATAEGTLP